jgi:Tfp pilus assembly protein PilE
MDRPAAQRGTTVVEVTLVILVLGVLASMAWPRFAVAGEQARVDAASAELRSLWLAQRLHWLETGSFADHLSTLRAELLIDKAVGASAAPFSTAILHGDEASFDARARRAGSEVWHGELLLDEAGQIAGSTSDGGQNVSPSHP